MFKRITSGLATTPGQPTAARRVLSLRFDTLREKYHNNLVCGFQGRPLKVHHLSEHENGPAARCDLVDHLGRDGAGLVDAQMATAGSERITNRQPETLMRRYANPELAAKVRRLQP